MEHAMTARVFVTAALVVVAACAGVLGLARSPVTGVFPHRAHVLAGASCATCHQNIERDDGSLHLPDDATCVTCHAKPHDTRSCKGCHSSEITAAELASVKDHIVFDHGPHLKGPASGNCMRCHGAVADADRKLRPAMATCFACHDDLQKARRCDGCHRDLPEEGTLPQSHLAHEGDWIREHGTRAASSGDLCETCHSKQSFCATCHGQTVPALAARTRFSDPFSSSPHRAGFSARHSLEARSDPGACSTCHQPDRCVACHTSRSVAGASSRSPHPRGWVGLSTTENLHGREARRDPAACASCHGGAGEQLCVGCHAVGGVGGSPHPPGWSSAQPMTALPCRMCHTVGAR
jgi:hypothetical protein